MYIYILSKVWLHAPHYTVFDYSSSSFFTKKKKRTKSSIESTKKEERERHRHVGDSLPGCILLSLSTNAVDSILTI